MELSIILAPLPPCSVSRAWSCLPTSLSLGGVPAQASPLSLSALSLLASVGIGGGVVGVFVTAPGPSHFPILFALLCCSYQVQALRIEDSFIL